MLDKEASVPRFECEVFLKTLALSLGVDLPGRLQIHETIVGAACDPLQDTKQRLIKLSKVLDDEFRLLAESHDISVSGLMRAVMLESMLSGRAKLLAKEIKKRGGKTAR